MVQEGSIFEDEERRARTPDAQARGWRTGQAAFSTHGALPRGGDPEAEASLHTGSWAAPLSDPGLRVFPLLCSPVLGHVPLAALPLPGSLPTWGCDLLCGPRASTRSPAGWPWPFITRLYPLDSSEKDGGGG